MLPMFSLIDLKDFMGLILGILFSLLLMLAAERELSTIIKKLLGVGWLLGTRSSLIPRIKKKLRALIL